MKEESKELIDAGYYNPDCAFGREQNGKIIPLYRDADYIRTDYGMEVKRRMLIGKQQIIVRSFFSVDTAKTPTQQLLKIIDSDLEKKAI